MFTPPYWFHDNIKFTNEEINKLKSNLLLLKKDDSPVSTFFIHPDERPDRFLNEKYKKIIQDIIINVGMSYKSNSAYTYWSQLYGKGNYHQPHNHAEKGEYAPDISFVHFLDVPNEKYFTFTDTKDSKFIPDEQSNGDLICFPSWVWHYITPNESNQLRMVVAGNIIFTEHFK